MVGVEAEQWTVLGSPFRNEIRFSEGVREGTHREAGGGEWALAHPCRFGDVPWGIDRRRAHQIAVAMFYEKLGRDVTPVQYAVLRMLYECPGLDQVTLAQRVALDTSTTADLAVRLEAKGLIVREVLPRRQRRLLLTPAGVELLTHLIPSVKELRAGLFDGMGEDDSQELMRLLRKFVHLNNEQSRAPLRVGDES